MAEVEVEVEEREREERVREPPLKRKRQHVSVVLGEREKAMLVKETLMIAIVNTLTPTLIESITFVTTFVPPLILTD